MPHVVVIFVYVIVFVVNICLRRIRMCRLLRFLRCTRMCRFRLSVDVNSFSSFNEFCCVCIGGVLFKYVLSTCMLDFRGVENVGSVVFELHVSLLSIVFCMSLSAFDSLSSIIFCMLLSAFDSLSSIIFCMSLSVFDSFLSIVCWLSLSAFDLSIASWSSLSKSEIV